MEIIYTVLNVLGIIVFYLTLFLGVALVPLGFAGEFVIIGATGIFIVIAGSNIVSWWVFAALLLLGLLAEGIEFFAGLAGAKVKGSFWSGVGAVVGGIVGSLIGASFAFIVGSIAGIVLGTFLGAYVVELYISKHSLKAAKVAGFALVARVTATVVKVAVSIVMIVIITACLLL